VSTAPIIAGFLSLLFKPTWNCQPTLVIFSTF
jgi:hypothetical protein